MIRTAVEKLNADARIEDLRGVNEERADYLSDLDITEDWLEAYNNYTNSNISSLDSLKSDRSNLLDVSFFPPDKKPVGVLAIAQWVTDGRPRSSRCSHRSKITGNYWPGADPLNETELPPTRFDVVMEFFGNPNISQDQGTFDLFSLKKNVPITTWFSGGGTLEAGLGNRVRPVGAVEYNKAILEHYNTVHGTEYMPQDIQSVDPKTIAKSETELFHASPVCCNFSRAKNIHTADRLTCGANKSPCYHRPPSNGDN